MSDPFAFLVGIVVLLVGISVSVALHEAGHFYFAKRFGLRVDRFMIGFGPTLFSRRIGETEYGVKLLPIGGFVSIGGMDPPNDADRRKLLEARIKQLEAGEVDVRSTDEQLTALDDRAYYRLPAWKRMVIMFAGPAVNLVLAMILFTIAFSGIGVSQKSLTIVEISPCVSMELVADCGSEDPLSPAAAAGLQPGDVITAIDGEPMKDFAQASTIFVSSAGEQLQLTVDRGGESVSTTVIPIAKEVDGEERGIIGIVSATERVQQPIWTGAATALENTRLMIGLIVQLPVKITETLGAVLLGEERSVDSPLSVVGMASISGQAAALDAPLLDRAAFLISLIASLNVALFAFNLIPLPPLDGGHIATAAIDGIRRWMAKLRGKGQPAPIDSRRLVPLTLFVGAMLVVTGGILVIADIVSPIQVF